MEYVPMKDGSIPDFSMLLSYQNINYISGGKRDEKLILPTNSSLSVTLDRNEVRNVTEG